MLAQQNLFSAEHPPSAPKIGNSDIYVGTSDYIFAGWRGEFYPEKLPQNRWLEYYSNYFNVFEINALYYKILPASSFEHMAEITPDNFRFWIKAPAGLTHNIQDFDIVLNKFTQSLIPLIDCGKLCGVLAQFPPSFLCNTVNLDDLQKLREKFFYTELAVEFRSSVWSQESVFDFFNSNDIIPVMVDLPAIGSLSETIIQSCNNIGYVRLHGRNEKTWYNPTRGDRYDYLYTTSELEIWCNHVSMMSEKAGVTFLFFNNCHAGQAVKNAAKLRELLAHEFNLISEN